MIIDRHSDFHAIYENPNEQKIKLALKVYKQNRDKLFELRDTNVCFSEIRIYVKKMCDALTYLDGSLCKKEIISKIKRDIRNAGYSDNEIDEILTDLSWYTKGRSDI